MLFRQQLQPNLFCLWHDTSTPFLLREHFSGAQHISSADVETKHTPFEVSLDTA
jgi:hypothetical protein